MKRYTYNAQHNILNKYFINILYIYIYILFFHVCVCVFFSPRESLIFHECQSTSNAIQLRKRDWIFSRDITDASVNRINTRERATSRKKCGN